MPIGSGYSRSWLPEIKRLFVVPEARGKGAAGVLMQALEDRARATGAPRVILQTGDRQPEAEALYLKRGWSPIPISWPYLEMDFSRCYELTLA
ncbi:GNAT family N-acetyltransferase [Nesterenkonia massiliensis]|uniref:GNAT family N-acetyltransferase n=1 Tax=Nesterenkonia massiliensis TaxID=1232429 RepID=A0ABT2HTC9_9MICC|nr:GNAT family N-acetyltransferase [Nesterenkonia massiliensis]MCT1607947.1 GNAT family N-acetyltransferase [Nesterenkonia massiliensis]